MRKIIGVVIDDNQANANVIIQHAKKLEGVEINKSFTNQHEGMGYIRKHHVDFIILDVEMNGISGLELMQALPKEIQVILYTGFEEYEDAGYVRKALDVLKKPTSFTRFSVAMKRVRNQLGLDEDRNELLEVDDFYFNIKGHTRYMRTLIRFKEIIYIENKNGRIYFHLIGEDEPRGCNESFKRVKSVLPVWFMQIHQSFIINTNFYRSYNKGMAEMTVDQILVKVGKKENYPDFFNLVSSRLL